MQQTGIERSLTNYNSLAMKESSDWSPCDVLFIMHAPGLQACYHPSWSMQTEFTVKTWEIETTPPPQRPHAQNITLSGA